MERRVYEHGLDSIVRVVGVAERMVRSLYLIYLVCSPSYLSGLSVLLLLLLLFLYGIPQQTFSFSSVRIQSFVLALHSFDDYCVPFVRLYSTPRSGFTRRRWVMQAFRIVGDFYICDSAYPHSGQCLKCPISGIGASTSYQYLNPFSIPLTLLLLLLS